MFVLDSSGSMWGQTDGVAKALEPNSWTNDEGTRGKESRFEAVIWGGASGEPFAADQAPNPFYLRIVRKGRTCTPGSRLEGMTEAEGTEHDAVTVLWPKGGLATGIFESEPVDGETPMTVDWFRIEALN